MRKNFPITELCEALGVSRSGYHNLGKREPSKRRRANEQLLHQIRIIHSDRHTRCYGSPRMTRELRALGIACSENRVARIMRSKDLRARPRRPCPPEDYPARSRGPILRPICYPKPGLLQLRVLSSLATSLTFLPEYALAFDLALAVHRFCSRCRRRISRPDSARGASLRPIGSAEAACATRPLPKALSRHVRKELAVTPSSVATRLSGRPLLSKRFTAS